LIFRNVNLYLNGQLVASGGDGTTLIAPMLQRVGSRLKPFDPPPPDDSAVDDWFNAIQDGDVPAHWRMTDK